MRIELPVMSAVVFGGRIYALLREGSSMLSLISFNRELSKEYRLLTLKGFGGSILDVHKGSILFAVDNELITFSEGKIKRVLKAHLPTNTFWHATRAGDYVYVQEYGESPTGIFALDKDYENPRLLITNKELDSGSRHFHNVVYDRYRGWLIVTLGDGNLVRVAVSMDGGRNWRTIYQGPWQFVPVVPLRDVIVFGMDSGIARGGIGLYYPAEGRWRFIFLRWLNGRARHAQMCDLKLLSSGLWVSALGTPQAIVVSRDLKTWYPLYVEGFGEQFNHHMGISEGNEFVAFSTGKVLLLTEKSKLYDIIHRNKPAIVTYGAYIDKLKGIGFLIKRKLIMK